MSKSSLKDQGSCSEKLLWFVTINHLKADYHSGVPFELLSMSISDKCLYALVVSSSLLLTYLGLFLAARVDLKERARKAWSRLRGRLPRNTRILLHTLSYYLAVTRSTCEVTKLVQERMNHNLTSDTCFKPANWSWKTLWSQGCSKSKGNQVEGSS